MSPLPLLLLLFAISAFAQTTPPSCKSLPTDESWPSIGLWDTFNQSIDGRLIKTVPVAAVCHDPDFDEQRCKYIQERWHDYHFHEVIPSSIMNPVFLNQTCDPFTPRDHPCTLGNYVQYAVNVSSPEHIVRTLRFVREQNVRFVVKNTGHDYMGRSTGAGAVSVWMHHLRDVTWIPSYRGLGYTGPAFKAYAGARSIDLVEAANARGHVVVGGQCSTVGFAGGYIQGGGHSVLTSMYGLAADQALEFEVVTTDGRLVIASPTENEDLFWALRGGGGGTYGIVWSVTIKAYEDHPSTLAFLNFTSDGIPPETYWDALQTYLALTPTLTAAQLVSSASLHGERFSLSPLFGFNKTSTEIANLINPFLKRLDNLGINYTHSITTYPTYLDAYRNLHDLGSIGQFLLGGWLMPRSVWKDTGDFEAFTEAVRGILDDGGIAVTFAMRATREVAGDPENAVLPAWREAEQLVITAKPLQDGEPLDQVVEGQATVTDMYDAALKKVAPRSGAYLNEADSNEPDFKTAFYGANYERLLAIKDKWDPEQILYGSIAVGGDRWYQTEEGRLCRT
ncbi:hypothetical protein PM082_004671 [Marasmius tenuissimus]|nr:hypothetical protein PM082_004671 [Marasmius tenuissimus]